MLFWQAMLSLPLFGLWSLLFERDAHYEMSAAVIGSVLYQGLIVAGLCFILLVFLIRQHSASRLGVFSFATPIGGVLLSAWLLGEDISPVLWVSVTLVALGIIIANRVEQAREEKSAQA